MGETGFDLSVTGSSGAYYLVYSEAGVCRATSNIVNLHFYDTTSVSINSSGSDTICVGSSVTLFANASGSGLSYAWLESDSNLNYSGTSINVVTPGFYQVAVTNSANCTDTSTAVVVVASPNFPPMLTYNQFSNDTLCNNAAAIVLSGGQPLGGYYSGVGVEDSIFNPYASDSGLNLVYYNYTDNTGCGNSIFDTVVVLLCTNISDLNIEEGMSLFPNPAVNLLTVQSRLLHSSCDVAVSDMLGKHLTLLYERSGIDKILLNINNLAPGCYFIQLSSDGRQICKRFIKAE